MYLSIYLSIYLEYDPKNSSGFWRSFMRLRVLLDVRCPLLRTKKIRKEGSLSAVVSFKYEKLGSFCYLWGPELRVDNRTNSGGGGARWRREDPTVGGSTMGRDGRRNQWEGTVSKNTSNAAIMVPLIMLRRLHQENKSRKE